MHTNRGGGRAPGDNTFEQHGLPKVRPVVATERPHAAVTSRSGSSSSSVRKRGVTSDDVDEATPTSTATTPSRPATAALCLVESNRSDAAKAGKIDPSKEVIAHAERRASVPS